MQICEVLADPTRARIVELLASDDLTAGEIAERFETSRPGVSRHLRVLREAGFTQVRQDGQRRIYQLDPRPLVELEGWLASQRNHWERRLDALGEHLDRMGPRTASRARGGRSSR
jgi:DNA-binding transcriptional ArsR family regulator